MLRPQPSEHPIYFAHYIELVKSNNVLKELEEQLTIVQQLISTIPSDKEDFKYAPGKWTIKEVIGHLIDTERIMAYRALRFARKDKTPLQGFDENNFVDNANFNERTLHDLGIEFELVRKSNLMMFQQFNEEALQQIGNANGKECSVRAILFMIAGHVFHHLNVIETKYLGH
jgi:hypothetical protein